jgi:hypothetical protein
MYCLSNPASTRSAGDFDSQDANQNTALGAWPFWLLFGQCQKVTRSPQASGSFASNKKDQNGFQRSLE